MTSTMWNWMDSSRVRWTFCLVTFRVASQPLVIHACIVHMATYGLKYNVCIHWNIYIYIITYICIKTYICWWNMVEPPFEGSKWDSYHPVVSWSRYIILYPFINDLQLGYWPVIKSFPQHIVLDNYIHHMIISLGQAPKWMLLFFPQQHQGYLQHDDS